MTDQIDMEAETRKSVLAAHLRRIKLCEDAVEEWEIKRKTAREQACQWVYQERMSDLATQGIPTVPAKVEVFVRDPYGRGEYSAGVFWLKEVRTEYCRSSDPNELGHIRINYVWRKPRKDGSMGMREIGWTAPYEASVTRLVPVTEEVTS